MYKATTAGSSLHRPPFQSWWFPHSNSDSDPPGDYFVPLAESDLSNLAKLYRDERLKQKAESLKLEHCEKLSSLIGMHKGG